MGGIIAGLITEFRRAEQTRKTTARIHSILGAFMMDMHALPSVIAAATLLAWLVYLVIGGTQGIRSA